MGASNAVDSTTNEWSKVRELLAEALSLPPSERSTFLDRHCARAPELRRELASLLDAADNMHTFLERPALEAGQELGPYRLDSKIGEGGMGEVYRAFDTRLERWVALKTVSVDLARSRNALSRFEREMRLLAAVDHVNVLKILDVGENDGLPVAVTELLDGETLAQVLARGRLPVAAAVDFAIQIAHGLAAVHAAGVVHRDLKPQNLFVTHDRTVKLLDFGIAKLLPQATMATWFTHLTRGGVLLGTPSYMSPEQARGEACDSRSDLFVFGAILYEMLSGRRAFRGESLLAIQDRVIRHEPEGLLGLRPQAGDALARIVRRCLDKDPEKRFQSARDLAFQLEGLDQTSTVRPAAPPPRPRKLRTRLTYAAAVAAILLTAIFVGSSRPPAPQPPPRFEFLTHSSRDRLPAVSREGRWLAYVSDRAGRSEIWIRQPATGRESRRTEGTGAPDFDPASDEILFTAHDPASATTALYSIGLLDGAPIRRVPNARFGAWSPAGDRVAFVREENAVDDANRWLLGIRGKEASDEEIVYTTHSPISHLRWSPDGRSLLLVVASSTNGRADELLRLDLESRTAIPIVVPGAPGRLSRPVVTGDGTLLVAHTASVTGLLPTSRVLKVGPGSTSTEFWFPAAIQALEPLAGGDLVFDAVSVSQQLREIHLGERRRDRWLTRGRSIDRQPVHRGDLVVFSSNRGGNLDLWRRSVDSGDLSRLTRHEADDWDPALSWDGRRLAWSSNRGGGDLEIYVAESDGLDPRPVTRGWAPAENPTFTRDGRWIVFSSGHEERRGLWRVRAGGGGEPRRIEFPEEWGRAHPEVSPSGLWVVFHDRLINNVATVRVVEVATGAPTPFEVRISTEGRPLTPGVSLGRSRWRPDEAAVAFVGFDHAAGRVVLLEQDFDAGRDTAATRRTLLDLGSDGVPESFAYGPGGDTLTVSVIDRSSTIMVARRSEPEP